MTGGFGCFAAVAVRCAHRGAAFQVRVDQSTLADRQRASRARIRRLSDGTDPADWEASRVNQNPATCASVQKYKSDRLPTGGDRETATTQLIRSTPLRPADFLLSRFCLPELS